MKKRKKYLLFILCFIFLFTFTVQPQAASKVKINKSKVTLTVGQKKNLKVKNTAKKVKWSSSKCRIADVDSNGIITAKKAGKAVITAKVGKKKYTCKVTVKEKPSMEDSETICVGRKTKLNVTGTARKIKWSTSNKRIVKVDQKGNIRGLKKGTATITANVGGKKLKCKVRVKDAVIKISRTVNIEDSGFVVLTYYSDRVSCTSSNPEIATVKMADNGRSEDGPGQEVDLVFYGHKSGTATITVTNNCNDKKMKFDVVVCKKQAVSGYEKLVDYIVANGATDEEGNKWIGQQLAGNTANVKIVYDYWEESLDYEYTETTVNGKIQWSVMGADTPGNRYIIMWITKPGAAESEYVTAKNDVAGYKGEKLVFEEAWYGTPAEESLQVIANSATKNAVNCINQFLSQRLNLTLKDVLK